MNEVNGLLQVYKKQFLPLHKQNHHVYNGDLFQHHSMLHDNRLLESKSKEQVNITSNKFYPSLLLPHVLPLCLLQRFSCLLWTETFHEGKRNLRFHVSQQLTFIKQEKKKKETVVHNDTK